MNNRLKQTIAVSLALLLCITGMPIASAEPATQSYDLGAAANTITALYNASDKTVNITGTGTIDRAKWLNMAQELGGAFDDQVWNDKNIAINFNTTTGAIKLPSDSSRLFKKLNGDITNINRLDTSAVTNMRELFSSATNFNQPLNSWNTTSVTDMTGMFYNATSFNKPLNNWHTENVEYMEEMFYHATSFNQPLNNWHTENVKDIDGMFSFATSFNQPLNSWNTTSVTSMSGVFYNATNFNQPLNNWHTENVKYMDSMFCNAISFNQPLNNWNTKNVEYIDSMFTLATSFNQAIDFSLPKLIDATGMFGLTSGLKQRVKLDAPQLERADYIFIGSALKGAELSIKSTGGATADPGFFNCPNLAYLKLNGITTAIDFYRAETEDGPVIVDYIYSPISDDDEDKIPLNIEQLFAGDYEVKNLTDDTSSLHTKTEPYNFSHSKSYEVCLQQPLDLNSVTVNAVPNQVYNGSAIVPSLTLVDNGYLLQLGVDYEITSQTDNILPGQATLQLTGIGNIYAGQKTVHFNIVDDNVAKDALTALNADHTAGLTTEHTLTVTELPSDVTVLKSCVTDFTDDANILAGTINATTTGAINYRLSGQGASGDSASATIVYYLEANTGAPIATVDVEISLTAQPTDDQSNNDDTTNNNDTTDDDVNDDEDEDDDDDADDNEPNNDTNAPAVVSTPTNQPSETIPETTVPTKPVKQFIDVAETSWYNQAVDYMVESGLMNGTSENSFSPQQTATRAMLVTMLYRLADAEAVELNNRFNDVSANNWYGDAITWAASEQIVNGFADGSFKPNQAMTREQLVVILYRYAQYQQYDTSTLANLDRFSDAATISPYAVEALQWAVQNGIINGTSETTISPQGDANRAQLATIIMRFSKMFAK